jgi:hypothetical protein
MNERRSTQNCPTKSSTSLNQLFLLLPSGELDTGSSMTQKHASGRSGKCNINDAQKHASGRSGKCNINDAGVIRHCVLGQSS